MWSKKHLQTSRRTPKGLPKKTVPQESLRRRIKIRKRWGTCTSYRASPSFDAACSAKERFSIHMCTVPAAARPSSWLELFFPHLKVPKIWEGRTFRQSAATSKRPGKKLANATINSICLSELNCDRSICLQGDDWEDHPKLFITLRVAIVLNAVLLPGALLALGWYVNRQVRYGEPFRATRTCGFWLSNLFVLNCLF